MDIKRFNNILRLLKLERDNLNEQFKKQANSIFWKFLGITEI